ncbi:hypothetical protein ACWKW6_09145 [Dyadobacter jiangsuensis]
MIKLAKDEHIFLAETTDKAWKCCLVVVFWSYDNFVAPGNAKFFGAGIVRLKGYLSKYHLYCLIAYIKSSSGALALGSIRKK